jgi:hypothetical protein
MGGTTPDWRLTALIKKMQEPLSQAPAVLASSLLKPSPSLDTVASVASESSHASPFALHFPCVLLCALEGSREDAILGKRHGAAACAGRAVDQNSSLAPSRTLPEVNCACIPGASCCRDRIVHPGPFRRSESSPQPRASTSPLRRHRPQRLHPQLSCLVPDVSLQLSPLASCARPAAFAAAQPLSVAVRPDVNTSRKR